MVNFHLPWKDHELAPFCNASPDEIIPCQHEAWHQLLMPVFAPNLPSHKHPDNTISAINNDNKNTSPTSGPVRNHNLKAFQRLSSMKINQCWQAQPNQGSWRQFPALLESCQPNPPAVNTVLRAPLTRENEQITWGGNKLELHHVMNGGVEGRNQPAFVLPNYLFCINPLGKYSGERS